MGYLYSYMVLATNMVEMLKMEHSIPQRFIENRGEEISEILDNLKDLLSRHQLTDEEFAILYGYIHLAKLQLMKMDDIRFILSNTLVKHQQK